MPALRALRVALAAMSLVVVTAACTSPKGKASSSGKVNETPTFTGPESAEPSTATTPPLSLAAVIPAPDGIGPLTFGTQAAKAMNGLTQALGRAENVTTVPPTANCGATRAFHWKDFDVLINEVTARSGGNPGLVGWAMSTAPTSLGLKTDKGIGIGSTLAAVKAAYGPVTVAQGPNGPTFVIRVASGVITGELNGAGDAGKVRALRAGASCPS